MAAFFERLAKTEVAIEACAASRHWARLLRSFGHEVRLIATQLVNPYVKHGKNDAADAGALCEAMSRPTMRFVPVKSTQQQAGLILLGVSERLIPNRTQTVSAIRAYAAEFGLAAPTGLPQFARLLEHVQTDDSMPTLARELFILQAAEFAPLQAGIGEN